MLASASFDDLWKFTSRSNVYNYKCKQPFFYWKKHMNKWGSKGVKGIKLGYKGQFLSFEMNRLNKINLSFWLVQCW